MAKINYNLLRERIRWVDLYATGKTRDQVVEEFKGEGATVNSVRTVIELARSAGLISGSHKRGNKITLDAAKREELMAGVDPQSDYGPLQATTERVKAAPTRSAIEIPPLELEALREMAQERIQRDRGAALRSGTPQETPTSVRLDSGLWEALMAYREAEGIGRSEAMNRAIEALLGAR